MINLFKVFMSREAITNARLTLCSGRITQGPIVDNFEAALREYFNCDYCITVNSCTSAIQLAYHLINEEIDKGYTVITTPLTCVATNFPIISNGNKIKWADIDDSLNIDLHDVKKKLDENTRVLSFVHWGGNPIDYGLLWEIKKWYKDKFKQHLYTIEDCAHAWDSYFGYKLIGTHTTDFSCFSCQAIKSLTTGDGGVLLTIPKFYKKARLARWFGLDRDNKQDFRSHQDIENIGFKYHMNDIAASLGIENLKYLSNLVNQHRRNAKYYNKNLNCQKQLVHNNSTPSYWLYTIRHPQRDDLKKYLAKNGVQSDIVHKRNDKYSIFQKYESQLSNMNKIEKEMLCIPVGWWITEQDREEIVGLINGFSN